jgi:hypothetical protein
VACTTLVCNNSSFEEKRRAERGRGIKKEEKRKTKE